MKTDELNCDVLVIGSGPGGAISACLCAENGKDVILIEEGPSVQVSKKRDHSLEEMDQQFRNKGASATFGKDKVAYVEGRCLGGASEINAGLYHRLPEIKRQEWEEKYAIQDFKETDLEPYFKICEKDVSISFMPKVKNQASLKLKEGAESLGYHVQEVPRWFKYDQGKAFRRSMSETYIPRALKAGARVFDLLKAEKIIYKKNRAHAVILRNMKSNETQRIIFKDIFICGGAIQTPFLLRRSGIKKNIGNSLRMHPMAKVAAKFTEKINKKHMEIPVHQVKEFAPKISLGCSISSLPFIALGVQEQFASTRLMQDWQQMAVYYATNLAEKKGKIQVLPFLNEPFVSYQITQKDIDELADGLIHLGEILFEAGATELYMPAEDIPVINSVQGLNKVKKYFKLGKSRLSTVHLFSSCPMGEDKKLCAVNSYGKMFGFENIYVNDASILPEGPGVNPQGAIMALAYRNVLKFLDNGIHSSSSLVENSL